MILWWIKYYGKKNNVIYMKKGLLSTIHKH